VLDYPSLSGDLKAEVERAARGYADPRTFFVEKLTEGVATIAAAFWPKPVIVRLSDFKSNEYKKLVGGARYEPDEENPMSGPRRLALYRQVVRECFEMECEAMRKVRNEIGLTNVEIMVPFVRTLKECREVIELLAANGLKRAQNGLRLIMMCECPRTRCSPSNSWSTRRVFDRLERSHAAYPRPGPRLGAGGGRL